MASKSGSDQHAGEGDFAGACRDAGTAFVKGMATAPFTAGFNLFWGSTAIGLRLFEQIINAGVGALQPPEKNQKKF